MKITSGTVVRNKYNGDYLMRRKNGRWINSETAEHEGDGRIELGLGTIFEVVYNPPPADVEDEAEEAETEPGPCGDDCRGHQTSDRQITYC